MAMLTMPDGQKLRYRGKWRYVVSVQTYLGAEQWTAPKRVKATNDLAVARVSARAHSVRQTITVLHDTRVSTLRAAELWAWQKRHHAQ